MPQSLAKVLVHLVYSTKNRERLIPRDLCPQWMKIQGVPSFAWQAGSGAFSVSEAQAATVVRYIQNQEEHHRNLSFRDEFRHFLTEYRMAFDERYVWD